MNHFQPQWTSDWEAPNAMPTVTMNLTPQEARLLLSMVVFAPVVAAEAVESALLLKLGEALSVLETHDAFELAMTGA